MKMDSCLLLEAEVAIVVRRGVPVTIAAVSPLTKLVSV